MLGRRRYDRHEEVGKTLNKHEKRLKEIERRLKTLEEEAGIFKPPLRGVGH